MHHNNLQWRTCAFFLQVHSEIKNVDIYHIYYYLHYTPYYINIQIRLLMTSAVNYKRMHLQSGTAFYFGTFHAKSSMGVRFVWLAMVKISTRRPADIKRTVDRRNVAPIFIGSGFRFHWNLAILFFSSTMTNDARFSRLIQIKIFCGLIRRMRTACSLLRTNSLFNGITYLVSSLWATGVIWVIRWIKYLQHPKLHHQKHTEGPRHYYPNLAFPSPQPEE